VLWLGVSGAVAALGLFRLRQFPIGSDGWWASLLLIAMSAFGLAVIELWWLASQREVRIDDRNLTIRTWLAALRGKAGDVIPRNQITHAGLTIDRGRNFRVAFGVASERVFWVGLWSPDSLRQLLAALRAVGIPTENQWEP
jgi:hypothetical protein